MDLKSYIKKKPFENVHEQNFWKVQDMFWKEQAAQVAISGPLYFSRDKLEVTEHNYGAFDARREWVEDTEHNYGAFEALSSLNTSTAKVEAKKSKTLKVEVEPPSLFSVFKWFFSVFKFFLLLPGIFKAFLSFIFLPFSCVLSILKFCKAVYQVPWRPLSRKQAVYVQGRAFPPIRLVLIGGGAVEVRAAEFIYERRTTFF